MISLLLCALVICCMVFPAFAEDAEIIAQGECGATASWKLDEAGTLTIYGTGGMKNYTYEDYNRPSYEEYKDQIKRLSITGISRIGNYAFYKYDNLKGELQIPSSITEIGDCSFERCTGYTGLCLYAGLRKIGFAAFRDCTGFEHGLVFPSTLEVIGLQAFSGCSGFCDSLVLPANLTELGAAAFRDCKRLTGGIDLPVNLTELKSAVFQNCTGLDGTINLGSKITAIGSMACYNCSSLSGDLTIPDTVTSIGSGAFTGCIGLQGMLTMSKNLMTIGDTNYLMGAFEGCDGLHGTLALPDTLTSIGQRTFRNCKSLSGVLRIPTSVTNIGDDAFHSCALNSDMKSFFSEHTEFLKEEINSEKAATCTEVGHKNVRIYCADCNGYLTWYQDVYPAKGHSLIYVAGEESTSDREGCLAHYRCSDCGALFYDADGTQPATEEGITIPCLPQTVKAEEIILNTEHIDLLPEDAFQLTATVLPEDAADKTVNWYTESNGIVTVDWNTGLVTAMLPGSTFVTCFSADGPLVTVPVTVHNPGAPTYENISVQPTCTDPGAGDLVIYCVDCGKELSREQGTIPATGVHTEDSGNQENIVFPDCTHGGSYDYVIRCTVCGEILSSVHHSTEPLGHNPGAARKTDVVAATCTEKGSYTETIRCETCGEIISAETHEIAATGHKSGDPEIGNTVTPTCTKKGSHSETVLCAVCGTVLSEKIVNDGYAEHNWDKGTVQSDEHDRYTVTDYTCTECGIHKTERHANPNYQFRCSRCDWYEANQDKGGIFGIVVWMVHTITHLVQQINYWT